MILIYKIMKLLWLFFPTVMDLSKFDSYVIQKAM